MLVHLLRLMGEAVMGTVNGHCTISKGWRLWTFAMGGTLVYIWMKGS